METISLQSGNNLLACLRPYKKTKCPKTLRFLAREPFPLLHSSNEHNQDSLLPQDTRAKRLMYRPTVPTP